VLGAGRARGVRRRTTVRAAGAAKLSVPLLGIVGASFLASLLVAGTAEARLGHTLSLLLLAAILVCGLSVIFAQMGPFVVVAWPVASVVAYVLVQLPRGHPIITFDRLWAGGILAYLALGRSRTERVSTNAILTFALLWLGVSFGLRAFATRAGLTGPVATWIDAIVVPTIIFFACKGFSASRARVQKLAAALMIAGGILGGIGIAERIWGFELATLTRGAVRFDATIDKTRISGPYPVPEPYALALIICLAATLYWVQTRRPRAFAWGMVFASLELGGIALSLFRAAWVGAIIVIIASFGLRRQRYGRIVVVAAIVAVASIFATWQLEQNKTFSTRVKNTDNIYARLATYEQGFQIFRSAPLFGVGVNEYHSVANTRAPVEVASVQSVTYPHNSYVGLLAEQGLVGFLPLLLLSFAAWRMIRALGRASVGTDVGAMDDDVGVLSGSVAGAAIAYLVMSLTLTMLPYGQSNVFFAALLGAAAGRLDSLARTPPQRPR
jgi:hypothetical protein